jgi:hypothetical protein
MNAYDKACMLCEVLYTNLLHDDELVVVGLHPFDVVVG